MNTQPSTFLDLITHHANELGKYAKADFSFEVQGAARETLYLMRHAATFEALLALIPREDYMTPYEHMDSVLSFTRWSDTFTLTHHLPDDKPMWDAMTFLGVPGIEYVSKKDEGRTRLFTFKFPGFDTPILLVRVHVGEGNVHCKLTQVGEEIVPEVRRPKYAFSCDNDAATPPVQPSEPPVPVVVPDDDDMPF